jgi:hypothetical protein
MYVLTAKFNESLSPWRRNMRGGNNPPSYFGMSKGVEVALSYDSDPF